MEISLLSKRKNVDFFWENTLRRLHTRQRGEIMFGKKRNRQAKIDR